MSTSGRTLARMEVAKPSRVRAVPADGCARGSGAHGKGGERRRPLRDSAREHARGAYRFAILAAAERVFVRGGFYETRMADIAREAGVGVGTLYNYFESKEVIFGNLLELRHREFRSMVKAAATAEDPVERLGQIVRSVLSSVDEKGEFLAVFMERGIIGDYDVERLVGASHARAHEEFLDLVERILREAVRRKKVRADVGVSPLATALSGAINGAIYAWLKKGRRARLASAADDLIGIFLEGARCR